jgi:hypothetical protein
MICGFPVEPAHEKPIDTCREASAIFGPLSVLRGHGQPTEETHSFIVPADAPACVLVLSTGSERQVSSISVSVDEREVVGPESFNQNVLLVERLLPLTAGEHTLRSRLAGPPGSQADITIRSGGSGERFGLVQDEHLSLFNVYAEPAIFSSVSATVALSARGSVLQYAGLPSSQHAFLVRWAFEIRNAACAIVRVLPGESDVAATAELAASVVWDGKDGSGAVVGDGEYTYRLVAELVLETRSGDSAVITTLATALGLLLVDATPPALTVLAPPSLTQNPVPVLVAYDDEGSGIEPASFFATVDGASILASLAVSASEATGNMEVDEGRRLLHA